MLVSFICMYYNQCSCCTKLREVYSVDRVCTQVGQNVSFRTLPLARVY